VHCSMFVFGASIRDPTALCRLNKNVVNLTDADETESDEEVK